MALDLAYERYQCSVNTVELGSLVGEGGTRAHVLKAGGQTSFPCLFEEGSFPNPTLVGLEIFDCEPVDWPDALKNEFGDCIKDPIMWAKKCVTEFGSKFLCVRLASGHPD